MQTTSINKSTSPLLVVGVLMVAAVLIWVVAFVVANQPAPMAVSQAAAVTAKGGNGKAVTSGAAFNVSITAEADGPGCNYKSFWSDQTQIWSGYPAPCTEQGYQDYIKKLFENGKIPEEIYNALKAVTKFW